MYKVYIITNTVNGKIYIGYTSKTLEERLKRHFSSRNASDIKFRRAIKKHGKENFQIALLEECDSKSDALLREIANISKFDSYTLGYNSTRGGETQPSKGKSNWNENSAAKFSESRKKWFESEEGLKFRKTQSEKLKLLRPHTYVSDQGRLDASIKYRQWLATSAGKTQLKNSAINMRRVQKLRHCGIFELVDPTGQTHTTSDIMDFCKEHHLSYHSFYHSINVSKKINTRGKNKDWKVIRWNDQS